MYGFAMKILSLHWYPDRRQPYRRVFERMNLNVREIDILMLHVRVGHGILDVRDVGAGVWGVTHGNTSTSARQISSVTGLHQSAVWHTFVGMSCIISTYDQYKFHSQWAHISSSRDGCYTRFRAPHSFCVVCYPRTRKLLQEVVYIIHAACMCVNLMLLITPYSSKDL
jgi:hypothetical protein